MSEDSEKNQEIEEIEKTAEHIIKDMIGTMLSLDNAKILYCLYRAPDYTTENITPERLIELAGVYSPPHSLEKIKSGLDQLRNMAFVYSEDGAYKLTPAGLSVAEFLYRLFDNVTVYDSFKESLPLEIRKIYDGFAPESREELLRFHKRFQAIDKNLRKGV